MDVSKERPNMYLWFFFNDSFLLGAFISVSIAYIIYKKSCDSKGLIFSRLMKNFMETLTMGIISINMEKDSHAGFLSIIDHNIISPLRRLDL